MVDVAESVKLLESFVVTEAVKKIRGIFEATVSTTNTVTLDDLTTIANALISKKSDGSNVAFTKATNVLTITEAAQTNVPVTIFAVGV
jgi:hypothetical protein